MKMTENKKTCCDGDAGLSNIAEELQWEILSRLPIIDLYRAKCVCSTWRSMITSPQFIQTNHRRGNRSSCLGLLVSIADTETREFQFYYARLQEKEEESIKGKEKIEDIISPPQFVCRSRVSFSDYSGVTQVVNGVVCLYSDDRLSLLNICTREILHLPKPQFRPPSSSHCNLGFDASNKVYKLLRRSETSNSYDVYEILTITTPISSCNWRKLDYSIGITDELTRINSSGELTRSFCENRSLFWMCRSNSCLLAFHLDNETFDFAYGLHPRVLMRVYERGKVMQCGQSFGLLVVSSSERKLGLCSLLGFEPRLRWTVYLIDLPDEFFGDRSWEVIPVGNLPNGDALLANDRANDWFTPVYSYNFESKEFKKFVVGKFPWPVAMSQMERASSVICLQEDLTPLHVLLGNGSEFDR